MCALAATGCGHTLVLKTEPAGAKVFTLDNKGVRGALLGQTPLSIEKPTADDRYSLEIAKEGYADKQFLSPALETGTLEVTLRLRPLDEAFLKAHFGNVRSRELNAGFDELLRLQAAVLAKRAGEVAELEKSMAADFDGVSLFHSLLGNHSFLQGNRADAVKRFGRALALDPANTEAQAMMRFLQRGSTP